jgi:osmotically-inducible protein OsmY
MRRRTTMRNRLNDLALGAALGSLGGYFFDPDRGRRRRAMLRDRSRGLAHRVSTRAERAGNAVGARTYGLSQQARHLRDQPTDYDDATLAHKVETELFRPPDVPKGQIDVNVQEGVVQLRGEVPRRCTSSG